MRAFLAVPVLAPALQVAQALCGRLREEVPAVRWTPTETLHITLHFFGWLEGAQVTRALAAVVPVMRAQPPMSLRLAGCGAFPPRGTPRVLWLGVGGDVGRLTALAEACISALSTGGFPVETRRFRAHCTVGRPRPAWPSEARNRWEELSRAPWSTPVFDTDRAVLYESITGSAGARHLAREVLHFGGR